MIAMGVGAVMALHSIHEAKARVALARVATRHQVPVSVVAQAVLAIVAGTHKPFGDPAGRAAAQLLVQGSHELARSRPAYAARCGRTS